MKNIQFLLQLSNMQRQVMMTFSFVLLFCLSNLFIAASDLRSVIRNNFKNQITALLRESSQIISTNYSTIDGIAYYLSDRNGKRDDIINDFEQYTKTIAQYTTKTVLLADNKHNIIASTMLIDSHSSNISVANRDYIKKIMNEPEHIHIGHLVRGSLSKLWSLPIAKGIFQNNQHIGTVILSIPLDEFSEGLLISNIHLQDIEFTDDNDPHHTDNLYETISIFSILKTSLLGKNDIIVHTHYGPIIFSLKHHITLEMSASDVQTMFWSKFIGNTFFFCIMIALLFFVGELCTHNISNKLEKIEEKLIDAACKLQTLVPRYDYNNSINITNSCDNILSQIESFVDSNALVVDRLERQHSTIKHKEAHLSILQKHFISCLQTLEAKSSCFIEDIEDLCDQQGGKNFLSLFEDIYSYSRSYEAHISSLRDSMTEAQQILKKGKVAFDITKLLRSAECFGSSAMVSNRWIKETSFMFYPAAIEKTILHIVSISPEKNYALRLDQSDEKISIEIEFDVSKDDIDDDLVQNSLEKARLFALLNEGFIGLFGTKNKLLFTIVYHNPKR